MQKRKPSQAPPAWLVWLGALGALMAVTYAVWDSVRQPAPVPQPPGGAASPPAAAQAPPPDDPRPGATFAELVQIGNQRMDDQQYGSAIRYYSAALELDSTAADVWVDRGACRHALKDEAGARADFRRGLGVDPLHAIAHFNMGVAFYTEGQTDSARSWWNRLLLISPSGAHADRARQLLRQIEESQAAPR